MSAQATFTGVNQKFENLDALKNALTTMGFTYEYHKNETGVVTGYCGRSIRTNAALTVDKNQFNGIGNFGFTKVDGAYVLTVGDNDDAYRIRATISKKLDNNAFNNIEVISAIGQFYQAEVLKEEFTVQGFLAEVSTTKDGKVKLELESMF